MLSASPKKVAHKSTTKSEFLLNHSPTTPCHNGVLPLGQTSTPEQHQDNASTECPGSYNKIPSMVLPKYIQDKKVDTMTF
jgi:hypothetical protein